MNYVTIEQICKHAGRSRSAVVRAIKRASVPVEKHPGVKGVRLSVKSANRFLALQWPSVGEINQPIKTNE